jgi:hypothetical protein
VPLVVLARCEGLLISAADHLLIPFRPAGNASMSAEPTRAAAGM